MTITPSERPANFGSDFGTVLDLMALWINVEFVGPSKPITERRKQSIDKWWDACEAEVKRIEPELKIGEWRSL